jgi:hypothetical protein
MKYSILFTMDVFVAVMGYILFGKLSADGII